MANGAPDDGAASSSNRRGLFVAALAAAIMLPLLAALLGLPPFDGSGRLNMFGADTARAGNGPDTEQVSDQPAGDDEADREGATEPDTAEDDADEGLGDPEGTEQQTVAETSPWGPIEHILRISLCDGEVCPRDDGDADALRAALEADPDVLGYVELTPEETYEWLAVELEALADRISADRLAGMFHVTLAVGTDPQVARDRFDGFAGVSDVTWLTEGLSVQAHLSERERFGFDDGSRRVAVHLCEGVDCPEITAEQRAALDDALAADPDVVEVAEDTAESAYERLQRRYPELPEALDDIDPASLPRPLRLTVADDADPALVADRYRDLAGVADVVWERHASG